MEIEGRGLIDPIAADDEATWPLRLLTLLDENFDCLRGHEDHELDMNRRYEAGDWKARYSPPPNPHSTERQGILDEAQRIVDPTCVIGYHCTRMHEHEIESVRRCGLVPLTGLLVKERLANAVRLGLLTQNDAQALVKTNLADSSEAHRSHMTWFVFNRSILTEGGGLWRFFTFWGGEAIYVPAYEGPLGGVLRSIGTPCIIEAAVPVAGIQTCCSVAERLLRCYLAHRNVEQEHESTFEGYSKHGIPRELIRRIVTRADEAFDAHTGCRTWDEPL